jgi:hypothetical protein
MHQKGLSAMSQCMTLAVWGQKKKNQPAEGMKTQLQPRLTKNREMTDLLSAIALADFLLQYALVCSPFWSHCPDKIEITNMILIWADSRKITY